MKTIALALLSFLLVGCAASNRQPAAVYQYVPNPAVVELVREGPQAQTPLVVLVGISRDDDNTKSASALHVHMRFENRGSVAVRFDPASLQLVNGSLRPFPPPRVQPPSTIDVAPGQTREIDSTFPRTGATADPSLSTQYLRLRWQVQVQGQTVPQDATFERVALPPPPAEPAWAGP